MTAERPGRDPTAAIAEHTTGFGARALAVTGALLLAVLLLGVPLAAHLRAALLAAAGLAAALVLWRDGSRRLHLFRDRLALIQGSRVREIPFREISAWSIPLGDAVVLSLRSGKTLRLARWRQQADLNAALIAAIRVAGSTFESAGRVTRVHW